MHDVKEILIVVGFGTVCFIAAVLATGYAINIALWGF